MPKCKPSHKGLRSCLGCGTRDERRALIRIAAAGSRVVIDPDRRLPGRGGYLHPRALCLEGFLASRIREFRSLKRKINADERRNITRSITVRLDSDTSVA